MEIVVVEVTVLREVEEELVIMLGVRFLIRVERERILRRLDEGSGRVGPIVTSSLPESLCGPLPRLREPIAEEKEEGLMGLMGLWEVLEAEEAVFVVDDGVLNGWGSQSWSLPCSVTGAT